MSVPATTSKERVGAIRPSQLLYTYGVGALVDLPNLAVIVAGLQAWDRPEIDIVEPRLLAAVQAVLGAQVERLVAMPWRESTNNPKDPWASMGVPVLPFPRWMRCTGCNLLSSIDGGLFKLESSLYRPEMTRFVHENCQGRARAPLVVPARFVTACDKGHLDEFPWIEYAHNFAACPAGGGNLELIELGSGTRSTDVVVRCKACGRGNMMSGAFERDAPQRPKCRGRHPHLRAFETCDRPAQTLLLGASNTWFGITRSALAIPVETLNDVDREVETLWPDLASLPISDVASLQAALTFNPALSALKPFDPGKVWAAIEHRRNSSGEQHAGDLKLPEWQRFIDASRLYQELDFTLDREPAPPAFIALLEQIAAVSRLRETTALIGFARIEAPDSGVIAEAAGAEMVPLTMGTPYWVPAADVRGEGIFLQLREEVVQAWETRVSTTPRIAALRDAAIGRGGKDAWRGARYVLLHSLAHLLINELALECGYGAASVRERIYAQSPGGEAEPMAGILVYTAAADSEGTLGGLVSMAKSATLERVMRAALHRAELCSSDPLCAEHVPTPEDRTQHGAACHSCLFLPETSCECNNRLLDRAVLLETLTSSGIAYFDSQ